MDKQDLIVKLLEQSIRANTVEHNAIIKRLDKTNGNVMHNTRFRIKTTAIVGFLKWGIGIVGFSGIMTFIHLISEINK